MGKYEKRYKVASSEKDLKTENGWFNEGFVIKEGEVGEECWTNYFCQHTAIYFTRSQVEQNTAKYIKIANKKREERRISRKSRLLRIVDDDDNDDDYEVDDYEIYGEMECTAWQWLSRFGRIPVIGEAHEKENIFSNKKWFYYYKSQTEMVTDEGFEQLKELYIEKFGGWEQIDLENTTYNGKVWWNDDDVDVDELIDN